MSAPKNNTPFHLLEVERRYIWEELDEFGIDREELLFLSSTLALPIMWQFDKPPEQMDYTAAQALFLRDRWVIKKPTARRIKFADEMGALSIAVWDIVSGATASANCNAAILDVLLSAFVQQLDRLKVLWILGQSPYTEEAHNKACKARKALPVNTDILDVVIDGASRNPIDEADADGFNEWLMQWFTRHLRYHLYDMATKQFGPLKKPW